MQSKRDTLPEGTVPEARESRESVDRISISTLPASAVAEAETGRRPRLDDTWKSPPSTESWPAGSETRGRETGRPPILPASGADVPARTIERLLLLWTELPVDKGDRAVTRAVVDAVASLLPGWHVGACLVPANGAAQEVIRTSEATQERTAGADPTRLFPGAPYERVVAIEPGGSTLHVASEDRSCQDGHSPSSTLLDRAAAVAKRGLELSRMQTHAAEALAEARSLNAHIAQAEKLASLGQIAAGVVHELNNPLTSIVAYTDYLIRKAGSRPSGADTDEIDRLRRISESAGRMLRFTRDLVSYARPSSETPVQVSVHLVIDQAIAFCEHVLAGAGVTVERHFAAELSPVRGKPEQLAQIFVNLVTNACHAMLSGRGTLTVTTSEEGGTVCVEIADTGHGIPAEHVPHVFTPFFTTKTSGAGTGLGLAIVKSILDGHGGTIRAASEPGKGATFVVTLPAWTR
jgi:two-component system NtrC family sensor kinase